MTMQFKTAQRKKAKLRLGIMGSSGSGKTMGALKLAAGIAPWEKIFVIDTEHGSAELYAHLGPYQALTLESPFSPARYIEAINAAVEAGAEVVIVDSLSHGWEGEGGALEMVDQAAAKSRSGNSFAAWKDVTPQHRRLVETMLQLPCHLIATLRSKTEYVLEKNGEGKTMPRKIGLAPIQRAGMEYEFTAFLDVNDAHMAIATKDRTELLDGKTMLLNEALGRQLREWLESGAAPEMSPRAKVLSEKIEASADEAALRAAWTDAESVRKAGQLSAFDIAEIIKSKDNTKRKLEDQAVEEKLKEVRDGKLAALTASEGGK